MLIDYQTIKEWAEIDYYRYNLRDIAQMYVYIAPKLKENVEYIDLDNAVLKVSRKVKEIKNILEADFIYDYSSIIEDKDKDKKKKNKYKLTRPEALMILYICIYQDHKNSIIYRLRNNPKAVSSEEILNTIKSIVEFMLDKRFKKDGEWYKKEYELFIINKKNPDKTIQEIDYLVAETEINDVYDYYKLRKSFEEFEKKVISTVNENFEVILNSAGLQKFPLLNYDKAHLQFTQNNQSKIYSYSEIINIVNLLTDKMVDNINNLFKQINFQTSSNNPEKNQ